MPRPSHSRAVAIEQVASRTARPAPARGPPSRRASGVGAPAAAKTSAGPTAYHASAVLATSRSGCARRRATSNASAASRPAATHAGDRGRRQQEQHRHEHELRRHRGARRRRTAAPATRARGSTISARATTGSKRAIGAQQQRHRHRDGDERRGSERPRRAARAASSAERHTAATVRAAALRSPQARGVYRQCELELERTEVRTLTPAFQCRQGVPIRPSPVRCLAERTPRCAATSARLLAVLCSRSWGPRRPADDGVARCEGRVIEQPFTAWDDLADYFLAPDGDFTGGGAGWDTRPAPRSSRRTSRTRSTAATSRRPCASRRRRRTSPPICVAGTTRRCASSPAAPAT